MERGNDAAIPNNEIYAKARGKGYVKMRIIGVNRLATAILSELDTILDKYSNFSTLLNAIKSETPIQSLLDIFYDQSIQEEIVDASRELVQEQYLELPSEEILKLCQEINARVEVFTCSGVSYEINEYKYYSPISVAIIQVKVNKGVETALLYKENYEFIIGNPRVYESEVLYQDGLEEFISILTEILKKRVLQPKKNERIVKILQNLKKIPNSSWKFEAGLQELLKNEQSPKVNPILLLKDRQNIEGNRGVLDKGIKPIGVSVMSNSRPGGGNLPPPSLLPTSSYKPNAESQGKNPANSGFLQMNPANSGFLQMNPTEKFQNKIAPPQTHAYPGKAEAKQGDIITEAVNSFKTMNLGSSEHQVNRPALKNESFLQGIEKSGGLGPSISVNSSMTGGSFNNFQVKFAPSSDKKNVEVALSEIELPKPSEPVGIFLNVTKSMLEKQIIDPRDLPEEELIKHESFNSSILSESSNDENVKISTSASENFLNSSLPPGGNSSINPSDFANKSQFRQEEIKNPIGVSPPFPVSQPGFKPFQEESKISPDFSKQNVIPDGFSTTEVLEQKNLIQKYGCQSCIETGRDFFIKLPCNCDLCFDCLQLSSLLFTCQQCFRTYTAAELEYLKIYFE